MVNFMKYKNKKTQFIKLKKILYNKKGQIIFTSSFFSNDVKRYYNFISFKGS